MRNRIVVCSCTVLALAAVSGGSTADDVNGSPDCQRQQEDHGDAPENVQAYPGILGRFSNCGSAWLLGTQELDCPAVSTPPGASGSAFLIHLPQGSPCWLGCYIDPTGALGLDQEVEGKVNDTGDRL